MAGVDSLQLRALLEGLAINGFRHGAPAKHALEDAFDVPARHPSHQACEVEAGTALGEIFA
jgi:hypothetical protein